jgi:hypothetical protein
MPKKIYTSGVAQAAAAALHHRVAVPSIRVLEASPTWKGEEPAERESVTPRSSAYLHRDDDQDSDDPHSALGDSDSESEAAAAKAGGARASNSFQETFAKFRQSYLSSNASRLKKVDSGPLLVPPPPRGRLRTAVPILQKKNRTQ